MRFIDATEVHQRLPYAELVEALAAHHLHDVDASESHVLEQPTAAGGNAHFLALPAWQRGRALGAKLVTVFPENEHDGSGLPSVQAVFILFDGRNGRPLACIDGTALTLRKTAGDSALGTKLLAPPAPATMLMVGAGALAPHLIMAHHAVRPSLTRVEVWNRTAARAEALVDGIKIPGVEVATTSDLEGSARQADVISCATMATEPLIAGAWLKPGAHLDLVGSYTPAMRECDDEALRRSSVFVDSPWSAIDDCGEIVSALESGLLARSDIQADAFTLARGEHPGRSHGDEITLYKNGGGGHLDLMVAQHLYDLVGGGAPDA